MSPSMGKFSTFGSNSQSNTQQDSRTATFNTCAFPYISMVPAILGALILLTYCLRLLDPYRPRWTKPFLREAKAESDELDDVPRHQFAWSTYGLLAVASIGLILQFGSIYTLTDSNIVAVFPSLTWVCGFKMSLGCADIL
jgi:hypothetical protein